MTVAKQRLMLEVAYDLISKVHSEICRSDTRQINLAEDTMEILRRIIILDRKLGKRKGSDTK